MKSISDQMQLMMMNQMMAQQMTAQQMQYAQMNAMMGEKLGGGGKEKKSKRKKPAVNIKSEPVVPIRDFINKQPSKWAEEHQDRLHL